MTDAKVCECSICTVAIPMKERVWTPCIHVFHGSCLDQWLAKKPECPACKHPIPEMRRMRNIQQPPIPPPPPPIYDSDNDLLDELSHQVAVTLSIYQSSQQSRQPKQPKRPKPPQNMVRRKEKPGLLLLAKLDKDKTKAKEKAQKEERVNTTKQLIRQNLDQERIKDIFSAVPERTST